MLEPKRIESNVRPNKFEDLKNGYWFYNYGIKPCEHQPTSEMDAGTGESYEYIQIRVEGEPTYKKCVELTIREFITQSQEFDLINSANRVLLNIGIEKAFPSKYLEYLDLVDEIKVKVKADFEM